MQATGSNYRALLFILLFGASMLFQSIVAQAEAIIVDSDRLVGVDGLMVDGALYDVVFAEGSFNSVFVDNGIIPSFFEDEPGAQLAANAIFNTLNMDGGFVDTPELIGGCTDLVTECGISIPYSAIPGGVDVWTVFFEDGPNDGVFFQPLATDSTFNGQITWAVFQPVPIPAAAWLFVSALVGLGVVRKKLRV